MALHQCVSFLTVMIVLLSKVHDSQSFECGRILINDTGTPVGWPWRVLITVKGDNISEGSLITDQWVLTLALSVQNYSLSDIMVFLHSNEPLSNPHMPLPLENLTCDPGNKLCLLKLKSPVALTDEVQPICLASESSIFFSGTEGWITTFSPDDTAESDLEIVGKRECECYNGPITDDAICTALKEREIACLGNLGGPLMNKNDSVWVQSGVLSSETCSESTEVEVGVFVRVSEYETWIRETVTGTPPIFVTFTSDIDIDLDMFFTCLRDRTINLTTDPTADPTSDPTSDPTFDPTTQAITPATTRATIQNITLATTQGTTRATTQATIQNITLATTQTITPPKCKSVFCRGESLIHFTHFTALCVLVVLLHVFVGSGGI